MNSDELKFCEQAALSALTGLARAYYAPVSEGGLSNVETTQNQVVEQAWAIGLKMLKHRKRMESNAIVKAIYCTEVEVEDPDTEAPVHLSVYKDPSTGGMLAIDSSFIEQVEAVIPNPLQPSVTLILDNDG